MDYEKLYKDALNRLMLKWKLPIGTVVRATDRYIDDDYEFVITK